ncbi:HlyC/CorC family transporter [Parvibaculum sp.]|uniref:HlyC/CorC family transporter n=1 Tax=Parvibaculum sp. TaxID=2024848 RepID=UPI0027302299|nr:HlyC/CorC family transporter [Parvibaculum sp.]MDP1625639.1 HlyC/CorC family transporter [Parvibaculum sp.]MDP2149002.1 HlyC/CorC family transporter [Parvibaculum sp.]MDP3328620.1 HlyC/CorC family transporter [Parvibaculum sp.]
MVSLGLGAILGAIILLLLFSAFFSGSETALTAASRARMHRLAEEGDKRARLVLRLTEDRERLIGAVLLGNNLVNIMASALATSLFLALFGDAGVVYATLVMTAVVLVFSEVAPKTFAITNTDRVALAVAPMLRVVTVFFGPVTAAVQFIVRHSFRLFGLNVDDTQQVLSAHEELRGAINLHHHEGSVVKIDRDMLGGILDLRDLEVSDIMVHRKNIAMIDAAQPNSAIISQALASPHTRIPLWRDEQENIIGVLHARDLLRAIADAGWKPDAVDIPELAFKPWFVPDTTTLQDQLNAFLKQKSHFALVVDEYGVLMGLITLEDILEEIVGDISDEHDIEVAGLRVQPDGSIVVSGSVPIRDLNRALEWSLPDDEATTIAGLVIHEARTIPDVGQAFTFHGFRFEILRRQRNQIAQLRIAPARNLKTGAAD